MRILVADRFSPVGLARLEELGHDVSSRPELGAGDLPAALGEHGSEVLIVRSTKVVAEAFGASPRLSLVVRAGAGVNNIDLETASRLGVFVANCPGKNAIAVAELTMGLLLSLDREIPDAVADIRAGTWNKKRYGRGRGLFGRTLGLVGFGAIAREVAVRAQAFGMRVVAFDPTLNDEEADRLDVDRAADLDTVLESSDAVSVHVPFNAATQHMIGGPQLAKMRQGALLIHAARGGVVDDAALREALASGHVRAGLDVFENEPSGGQAPFDNGLRELAGLYATPHIGASTEQAAEAIAAETVRIVEGFAQSGVVYNCVNVAPERPAGFTLVVRHHDRVGVLAAVLERLRRERLNVKQMQNVVFSGADAAASATISLEKEPSADLLDALANDDSILAVDLRASAS